MDKEEPTIQKGITRLKDGWTKSVHKLEVAGVKKHETYLLLFCALLFLFSLKYGLIFLCIIVAYYIFALSKERNKNGNGAK